MWKRVCIPLLCLLHLPLFLSGENLSFLHLSVDLYFFSYLCLSLDERILTGLMVQEIIIILKFEYQVKRGARD